MVLSVILNRTDNFPDARTLPVRQYLNRVNENIFKRKKMHYTNTIMILCLYAPAVFLAFNDLYAPDFIYADILNWVLKFSIVLIVVIAFSNFFKWRKEYEKRIIPVKMEIEEMIAEMN